MKVFSHHIYEYQKGLRNLVLHTMVATYQEAAIKKLKFNKIDYVIQRIENNKINIFFGAEECVAVIKQFIHKNLNEFTAEQDFILGIMLGYDRKIQCKRFLNYKQNSSLKTA